MMSAQQVAAALRGMSPTDIVEFLEAVGEQLMFGLAVQLAIRDENTSVEKLQELQCCTLMRTAGNVGDTIPVRRLEDLIRDGVSMLDAVIQVTAEGMIEGANPDEGWGA